MSRVRDIANILSGGSSAIATDAEIPSYVAGKNFVINGGFDIWQRGTSFVSPFNIYTTDRWSNDTTNMTISRQSSGAPLGSLYYLRTTSTGSSAFTDFYHFFETANVSSLWGKTVIYSFKVRKSGTTPIGSFILTLQKSATVDAGRGSTWTTVVSASTAFSNISTGTSSSDWTTVTATATIPNDGSANSLRFIGGFDNAQASGVIVDIAQVQLEAGSIATPFSRSGGSIQGELALCYRYYENNYPNNLSPGSNMQDSGLDFGTIGLSAKTALGGTNGANRSRSQERTFMVQKRSSPSIQFWDWVGNASKYSGGNVDGSLTNNNLSVDQYGGIIQTNKTIAFQTVTASSTIAYASVMWAASAEL